jgi:archaellum biogenesis protein FlaJ (TadC family)
LLCLAPCPFLQGIESTTFSFILSFFHSFFLLFVILLLLYWGYIVTFTKVLTIYHSWIHSLHHSPLPLSPIILLLIFTLTKDLLSSCYVSGIVLGAGDIAMCKTDKQEKSLTSLNLHSNKGKRQRPNK